MELFIVAWLFYGWFLWIRSVKSHEKTGIRYSFVVHLFALAMALVLGPLSLPAVKLWNWFKERIWL